MVAWPGLTGVSNPELSTVAISGVSELHTTCAVISCVVLSTNVAVAVNWTGGLPTLAAPDAVIEIDCNATFATINVADDEVTPFNCAEILVVPEATQVANPE